MIKYDKLRFIISTKRVNGLRQSDLAEQLKISPSRLSQITWGRVKPTLTELERFCLVFECQLSDLATVIQEDQNI